ncbi:hypothetical protein UlMin_014019 [Ulmus minor]
MEPKTHNTKFSILVLYIYILSTLFIQSDAGKYTEKLKTQFQKLPKTQINEAKNMLRAVNHLNIDDPFDEASSYEEQLELSSPFSLPPFESLSPQNAPPYFVNPPFAPSPKTHPPPPPPPHYLPGPPKGSNPSPPKLGPNLSPPVFLPPIIYPPPSGPPSGHQKPKFPVWCVAKPTVPEPIIQEALDYACGSGADCKSIEINGPCYHPASLVSHASYAFNSYWQNTKVAGGTCDFGGTAMLVTDDPIIEIFLYNSFDFFFLLKGQFLLLYASNLNNDSHKIYGC